MSMSAVSALNPDVLELIFSRLSFRDLVAARVVCRAWRRVIDSRCRTLTIRAANDPSVLTIMEMVKSAGVVRHTYI